MDHWAKKLMNRVSKHEDRVRVYQEKIVRRYGNASDQINHARAEIKSMDYKLSRVLVQEGEKNMIPISTLGN